MMDTYDYTEDGNLYRRTVTHEEEIARLKEELAMLGRYNRILREALYAAQSLLEDIDTKAEAFKGLSTGFCREMVSNALNISRAAMDLSLAQDALRKCKEF